MGHVLGKLILLLLVELALFVASPESAAGVASAENSTSWSATGLTSFIGIEARLSEEAVRENAALAYDLASDDAVAAKSAAHWGNPKTLADHFARHGKDFGAKSADDCGRQAAKSGTPIKLPRSPGHPSNCRSPDKVRDTHQIVGEVRDTHQIAKVRDTHQIVGVQMTAKSGTPIKLPKCGTPIKLSESKSDLAQNFVSVKLFR